MCPRQNTTASARARSPRTLSGGRKYDLAICHASEGLANGDIPTILPPLLARLAARGILRLPHRAARTARTHDNGDGERKVVAT